MKRISLIRFILPLVVACALRSATDLHAAEPHPQEAEIAKTAKAFIEAFHKGDAKAVAAFWTPDGDYIDESGRVFKGRKAIEDNYVEFFANNKGLALRIDVAGLKFPTPDMAIEDGTSAVIPPDGSAPSRARYTNVLVKKDGQWLLSSVREMPDAGPSNYEFLRPLEWTIGEWIDETATAETGHISFNWAPGQNFIVSTRTVDYSDTSHLQATQWIAWDAAAKQIRSWTFQADGGFGEGTWKKDGDKWIIKTDSVLADGSKVSATNVVASVDANTLTWQSREMKLNGNALPDTKAVRMKRVE
jgi:uncharacterized protein (TIGR02246 family)